MAMLAERFDKKSKYIQYPAYVQPKFDGVRALYNPEKNEFLSRSGLPIGQGSTNIKHELLNANWPNGKLHLDGELYAHGLSFQNVMKLAHSNDPKLKYFVYDFSNTGYTYGQRNMELKKFFEANHFKHIVMAKTELVSSAADVKKAHDKFKAEGYEGAIVRNAAGKYVPKRTNDLQKVKEFQDAEFKVIGASLDNAGKVMWECTTKEGKTFKVKPTNADVAAQEGLQNAQKYIGRLYTVQFQELTDSGVPRFPVGLGFKALQDIDPEIIEILDDDVIEILDDDIIEILPSPKRSKSPKRSPKRSKSPKPKSPKRSPKPKSPKPKSPKRSPKAAQKRPRSPEVQKSKKRGCVQQYTAKYTSRPSPPYPANECCNETKLGNDGNMYTSWPNKAGICTWKQS